MNRNRVVLLCVLIGLTVTGVRCVGPEGASDTTDSKLAGDTGAEDIDSGGDTGTPSEAYDNCALDSGQEAVGSRLLRSRGNTALCADSGVTPILGEAELNALWAEYGDGAPTPALDFDSQQVLCVSGYAAGCEPDRWFVEGVYRLSEGSIVARVHDGSKCGGCDTGQPGVFTPAAARALDAPLPVVSQPMFARRGFVTHRGPSSATG